MGLALGQVPQTMDQEHRTGPAHHTLAGGRIEQFGVGPDGRHKAFKSRAAFRPVVELVEDCSDLGIDSLSFFLSFANGVILLATKESGYVHGILPRPKAACSVILDDGSAWPLPR
jgi:hypothetical protein